MRQERRYQYIGIIIIAIIFCIKQKIEDIPKDGQNKVKKGIFNRISPIIPVIWPNKISKDMKSKIIISTTIFLLSGFKNPFQFILLSPHELPL